MTCKCAHREPYWHVLFPTFHCLLCPGQTGYAAARLDIMKLFHKRTSMATHRWQPGTPSIPETTLWGIAWTRQSCSSRSVISACLGLWGVLSFDKGCSGEPPPEICCPHVQTEQQNASHEVQKKSNAKRQPSCERHVARLLEKDVREETALAQPLLKKTRVTWFRPQNLRVAFTYKGSENTFFRLNETQSCPVHFKVSCLFWGEAIWWTWDTRWRWNWIWCLFFCCAPGCGRPVQGDCGSHDTLCSQPSIHPRTSASHGNDRILQKGRLGAFESTGIRARWRSDYIASLRSILSASSSSTYPPGNTWKLDLVLRSVPAASGWGAGCPVRGVCTTYCLCCQKLEPCNRERQAPHRRHHAHVGAVQAAASEKVQRRLVAGAYSCELEDARVADSERNEGLVRLLLQHSKFWTHSCAASSCAALMRLEKRKSSSSCMIRNTCRKLLSTLQSRGRASLRWSWYKVGSTDHITADLTSMQGLYKEISLRRRTREEMRLFDPWTLHAENVRVWECESVSVLVGECVRECERVWDSGSVWVCECVSVWESVWVWECESVRVSECESASACECECDSVTVWQCDSVTQCDTMWQCDSVAT